MNDDVNFIRTTDMAVTKYIHGFIRRAFFRKLFFFLAAVFILYSTFAYFWWYSNYYDQTSSHVTRNGHFVRFLDSRAEHVEQKECYILAEEQRIFQSIRREHVGLVKEFAKKKAELESLLLELANRENDLRELNLHISQLRILQRELNDKRNVKLSLPNAPLIFKSKLNVRRNSTETYDSLDECIDYRRCSISSPFRFYLYDLLPTATAKLASSSLHNELLASPFRTDDADRACIFVAIHDPSSSTAGELKYWLGDGRNHLLLINEFVKPDTREFGAAAIVSRYHAESSYRHGIDIAVELNVPPSSITEYQRLPQLLPYAREHLLAFMAPANELSSLERSNLVELQRSANASGDSFSFYLNCAADTLELCHNEKRRVSFLRQSHFTLVFAGRPSTQTCFRDALLAGAIPVIVGQASLSFDELIDWRLAAVNLAAARLPELHFILRSISAADLLEMRRKGRTFLESYLANTRVLSRSILSVMRYRLQMPADGAPSARLDVSNDTASSSFPSTATRPPYDDEYLGPLEPPVPSSSFTHNSTVLRMYSHKIWNELPSHAHFTPEYFSFDAPMPSETEFDDEVSFGMRPIAPGSGREFATGLGGNRQREQFTIVIMTHNRDAILNASLERLHQLPYLNKVLVIWNNVDRPNDLSWPRIHVPIVFLRAERNSLNNRFLPLREIKTEAVLSMDDDIDLKQHEIIFAFRTWRENRHRLVGFPARYHAKYGDSITYNSNHTCQYSMILTGAAFFHKEYLYAYTHYMPAIIRRKVDEWMNCEDLAMNFLVSHLTRLPPIKTTSKWTLKCSTCPETLSNEASHFNERHNCVRFFTQVYGYNPLLFTQIRADSVLFKTRVPLNHQKCFRYV